MVSTGAVDAADYTSRCPPILGRLSDRQNAELRDCVRPKVAAQNATRSVGGVSVDADPIQKVIVLLGASAADGQFDAKATSQTIGAGDGRHYAYGRNTRLQSR